jgi:hypothetical protein
LARDEIVVDGTDSAGKTPTIEALALQLEGKYNLAVYGPFKQQEVFPLWSTQPQTAASIITGIMAAIRQEDPDLDLIIWDRGWPTAWVSTTDAVARAMFLPFPTLTVLLLNTVKTTREKVKKYNLAGEWVTNPELLRRFNRTYHDLGPVTGACLVRFHADAGGRFDIPVVCQKIEEAFVSTLSEIR